MNCKLHTLGVSGFLAVSLTVACAQTRAPEAAKADPWQVWIHILKGLSGKVYYLGSSGPYGYFRIGDFFPGYYKSPACNFVLPRTFPLGSDQPYIVTMDNARGYGLDTSCSSPKLARPGDGT